MDETAVSTETEATTQDDVADTVTTDDAAVDATAEDVVTDEVVADAVEEEVVETSEDEVVEAADEDESEVVNDDETDLDAVDEDEDELASFTDLGDANKRVKELQKENTRRRLQNKDVDSAFEGSQDGFRDSWLELARMLNGSEEEQADAVEVLRRFVSDGSSAESEEVVTEELSEESIMAKVGALFDHREQRLAVQTYQAQIDKEELELGYNREATLESDPVAFSKRALLWQIVAAQPEGQKDLQAAHAAVEAYNDAVFNAQLEALQAANTGLPQAHGGVTSVANNVEDTEPVSAFEAMKRAEEESIRRAEQRKAAPQF